MDNDRQPAPEVSPRAGVLETRRRQGKDRSFICSEDLRNGFYNGKKGFFVRVRLTSYRSLPLSCIEKIELSIDGQAVDPGFITFILNGYHHQLNELAHLSQVWWFILDCADLFVESKEPLPAGEHLVEGTLVTVEPYVTGGRFTFFYPSQKKLSVADEF